MTTTTVNELLHFLRNEWQLIEEKFPEAYADLGHAVHANKNSRNCLAVDVRIEDIDKMLKQQGEISRLKTEISSAEKKLSTAIGEKP